MITALALLTLAAAAPTFDAGSDGSYGSLFVAASTSLEVVLPPDGVIHATDITVETDAVLTFTRNANNTPVYLLSQGDVLIDGTVDLTGATSAGSVGGPGGPGGFAGGIGTQSGNAYPRPTTVTHEARLLHLIGGYGGIGDSDGVPNCGGGGGGGALLLASDTVVTLNGLLDVDSGSGGCPEFPTDSGVNGDAGAVRVVAPRVGGSGEIQAASPSGAAGYARIDSLLGAYEGLSFNGVTPYTTTAQATAGQTMLAMLPTVPQARIVSVAGQAVAQESGAVSLTIPAGSATTQDVVVELTGVAPSGSVVVTIERWQSGPSSVVVNSTASFARTLVLSSGSQVTIPVDFTPLAGTWLTAIVR